MIRLIADIRQDGEKVNVSYAAGPVKGIKPTAGEIHWTNELVAALVKHLGDKGCDGFAQQVVPPVPGT